MNILFTDTSLELLEQHQAKEQARLLQRFRELRQWQQLQQQQLMHQQQQQLQTWQDEQSKVQTLLANQKIDPRSQSKYLVYFKTSRCSAACLRQKRAQ